jgi:NAD(P)H-hydrate epimerase
VIAGRGNNGGDGFVIARYLAQRDIPVTVFLLAPRARVQGDAAANLDLLDPLEIPVIEMPDAAAFAAARDRLDQQEVWVDAILGTGLNSDVRGYFRQVIEFVNATGSPVFSVDIPSGLNSDTGQVCGTCIRADGTATFAFAKTGHLLYPGAELTGTLDIIDIGIPPHIARRIDPRQQLLTRKSIRKALMPRVPDAHKGHTGHLLVLAGSPGKTGAAAMTAMAAMRTGAGLVTLGVPEGIHPAIEPQVLEAMSRPIPDSGRGIFDATSLGDIRPLLDGKRCLALGPGIGTQAETRDLVRSLVAQAEIPMVIDADGLNCLAGQAEVLKQRRAPTVLTPHPGEMGRLVGCPPREVQADRLACAREFAAGFGVCLVLKGARTVIAHPDGRAFINPTGNAGMASGGMGDVLTGMIAGLVVQGYTEEAAAHLGVYLHGAAADELARNTGPHGYLASEVMAAIPGRMAALSGADDEKGA